MRPAPRPRLLALLAALATATLGACGDATAPRSSAEGARPMASLALQVNTAAAPAIASLVVEISAEDLTTPLGYTLTVQDGSASGTVQVPPGRARTFTVRAHDSYGRLTHQGQATMDVRPGVNPALDVRLTAVNGQVPINVTVGGAALKVAPSFLSLALNDTTTVTASVTGADGKPVPDAAVHWTSSDPARVSVTAAGLVQARDTGTVRVLATHDGVAAAVTVVVTSGAWQYVGTGVDFSCGLTRKGKAYCWGNNEHGQLGSGSWAASAVPVAVAAPAGGIGPVTFARLNVGGGATCGVTAAGKGYCWGHNGSGQLGIGFTTKVNQPREVGGNLAWREIWPGLVNTCGITTDDKAWCWGRGTEGQNGDGTTNTRHVPVRVQGGPSAWRVLTVGQHHACGIGTDKTGWCWGQNHVGQLGLGTASDNPVSKPAQITGGQEWHALSAGVQATCGASTGLVGHCWGDGTGDRLGIGGSAAQPTVVPDGDHVHLVRAPGFEKLGCSLRTFEWLAQCWGAPATPVFRWADGAVAKPRPALLEEGPSRRAAYISQVWGWHGCVITLSLRAYCAGVNTDGRLGDGTTTDSRSFVEIKDPE